MVDWLANPRKEADRHRECNKPVHAGIQCFQNCNTPVGINAVFLSHIAIFQFSVLHNKGQDLYEYWESWAIPEFKQNISLNLK
jgi:hypothetical protein